MADLMDAVAALSHVRGEAALEIAIAEERDFSEEREAQADFERAADAEECAASGNSNIRSAALSETSAAIAKKRCPIVRMPRNKRASTVTPAGRDQHCKRERGGREKAVSAEEFEQFEAGSGALFL